MITNKGLTFLKLFTLMASLGIMQQGHSAIALDRTRAIFNGDTETLGLIITNYNKELPYLAQAWLEDDAGNKIQEPIIALPPLQRVEPGNKGQVVLRALPKVDKLPTDRESIFYFNLREIPPRSDKPNTLQLALQTKIKLFYRPASIVRTVDMEKTPYQEELTLTVKNGEYILNNPTPYYITISSLSSNAESESLEKFQPFMVAPYTEMPLGASVAELGKSPVLSYINDYGGKPLLIFGCQKGECKVTNTKMD